VCENITIGRIEQIFKKINSLITSIVNTASHQFKIARINCFILHPQKRVNKQR